MLVVPLIGFIFDKDKTSTFQGCCVHFIMFIYWILYVLLILVLFWLTEWRIIIMSCCVTVDIRPLLVTNHIHKAHRSLSWNNHIFNIRCYEKCRNQLLISWPSITWKYMSYCNFMRKFTQVSSFHFPFY